MVDVYAHNKVDSLIIKLFNTRLLILLGALILPFLIIGSNQISINADPLILYLMISVGFLTAVFIFSKSISNPVIIYIGLQMMLSFIFLDKKILCNLGLSLKFYGIIFIIGLFTAAYHLIKNFKYLWTSFPIFKYLFVYFIFIGLYLLFHYHSDFRLSNDLLSLRYKIGGIGNSQTSREFGDLAKYILCIEWLIPIVSVTVSLMLFKGLKTVKDINSRLNCIIKSFAIILLIHFSLSAVASLVGFNKSFINIGAENDVDSGYFFPLFLLILLGFKYYLANLFTDKNKKILSFILTSSIVYIIVLIVGSGVMVQGSSAMILGIIVSLSAVFLINCYLKIKFPSCVTEVKENFNPLDTGIDKIRKLKGNSTKQLIKTILFIGIAVTALAILVWRMSDNFSSDLISLNMRIDHWRDSYNNWINSLDLFKILFGYGLDRLRETLYFASNSSAIERGIVSPHNLFILMIYDQGLVSLIYLAGIISTVISSIKYINDKSININLKIFSIINIAVVSSIFAMWCFVDMALTSRIMFLCMLGFLESVKFAYFSVSKKQTNISGN